ncbi:helix-turn-helix domain-containing protein [Natrialbaceae archaeon AArc-T1-2]|uniref:helix-turn-helix domain-containing protein n=1 Tax=Natrialbaceae archaeon AArc-T1-2 TaxID=3053904 RepID=UPI00255A8337|nr:helix-turn-helix domain-containing protein [Natrialbaceae archaeon AArc-T1-2]WIV68470.1 helix-turn-helix domain-containing protein [Natrialbaceae archaeon AArc-T1-2]
MVLTADVTVPTDTFALGSLFQAFPDAVVEFEPVVPLQSDRETNLPLVWISGVEPDAAVTTLRETDDIEVVERLATAGEGALFELEWTDELDGIVQPLLDAEGRILTARGTAEHWEFHLLFDSHVSLSEFNMAVTNNGVPVTLRRLSSSTVQREPGDVDCEHSSLPPNHRETLLLAYHSGYYETPRECQLADLAAKEDVSDSALSKRLRRATSSLIERTLLAEENLDSSTRG